MRPFRTLLGIALALPAILPAQGRRPITQDVYDGWRSIQGATLSRDGRWAAYSLVPQVGDGELVVRATTGPVEYRATRGFVGRPQLKPNADSSITFPPAQFTPDDRHVLFLAQPPRAEVERAKREKRKASEEPKGSLGILSLADGRVEMVPRVKSFRQPKVIGHHVAYLLEGDGESVDSANVNPPTAAAAAAPGEAARPVSSDSSPAGTVTEKEFGSTLVLRDLRGGGEVRIADVTTYAFDDSGRVLAYTVSSRQAERDGAYARALADGATRTLLSGAGEYKQLALDRSGRQIAFLSDRDERGREYPRYTLYHVAPGAPTARPVVAPGALPAGTVVAERGRVRFTRDGSAIAFGTAPAPLDSIPADSLAHKAVFDLWHYRDARLQPQQRVEARRDRDRSTPAVYQIAARRVVPLGSDTLQDVTLADDGSVALAEAELPYAIESMWGEGGSDIYLIDARTGARRQIATRVPFGASLSPGARYVVYFTDGRWYSHAVRSGRTTDLTGGLQGVSFDQETWDLPSTAAPWGVAGWTAGDATVLLYDRYDVWEVDPSGAREPRMVTDSVGARERLVLRVVDLDEEERAIDPAAPLLLRAFDEETKASGFYRDRLGAARPPERILMADRRYGTPEKARNADMYLVTQSTFRDFPDLHAGPQLDRLTKISDANPQQALYRWGTAELVRWWSADGAPLKGILYKPEGFDPARQYPMIVYFYEQLSDNLHLYHPPFGRNTVNPTVYTSLGYLVFFPDIAYTEGYPGPSAFKSVVPGVQSLIARGFVNPRAIGIAGQSWGGYQTAYIITQTNLFAAAVPNATVANMTSAYGGIRWGSGVARAFQYENTQSRIGGSLWEYPERYIENSPLFFTDRVQTPVLTMHNDDDGAVPWSQGIEYFIALRRLGKEAYLINYNGDGHNPTKRANQLDMDLRMQQFFAHHLLGQPKPDWMERGIPFLQKGRGGSGPEIAAPPPPTVTGEPATAGGGPRP